jgi:hypothetical protein
MQRELLADGRLPECWIPPAHILDFRALLETYHELREQHTGWVQRIHAVLFHQGAPSLAGSLHTDDGQARLAEVTAAQLSTVGKVQVAVALEMMAAIEVHLDALRARIRTAARRLQGAKDAHRAALRGGAGHRAGADVLAGWGRPVQLGPQGSAVRRAGCDCVLLRRQALTRAPVSAGTTGAALGRLRGGQDHARTSAPDHAYYTQVKQRHDGKRAAISEARKIIRRAAHILGELGDDALATT